MLVIKGTAGSGKSRRMRELYVKDVNNGKKVLLIDYELRAEVVKDLERLIPEENRENIVINFRDGHKGIGKEELVKRVKDTNCCAVYLDCGMREEDLEWLNKLSTNLGVKVVVTVQVKNGEKSEEVDM